MVISYFNLALRILRKEKGYSLINILGLSIGITCSFLIFLFVVDEFRYDHFHDDAERIYRVTQKPMEGIDREESSGTPYPLAETLLHEFPADVEHAVRFTNMRSSRMVLRNGFNAIFNESSLYFADPAVFNVFSFKLERGNEATALANPNSIVMTRAKAEKYFGDENPIGQILRFEGRVDVEVTGILEEVPPNSHIRFDILVSMSTLANFYQNGIPDNWFTNSHWTYVKLAKGISAEELNSQLPDFSKRYLPEVQRASIYFHLQPLLDIRLRSSHIPVHSYENVTYNNVVYLYIFTIIALFILLIACVNFMNLSTARSARRANEIGMRKVLGARREQLIGQFLSESFFMSLIAVMLSAAMIWLALPVFNDFVDKQLVFNPLSNFDLLLVLVGITVLVGFLSGIYPALFLSSFEPLKNLKGKFSSGSNALFRKVLVVGQFSISISLIIGTVIVYSQLNHLRSADLGFDKDQVVMIPADNTLIIWYFDEYKHELLQHSGILSVTGTGELTGGDVYRSEYVVDGVNFNEGELYKSSYVHYDFLETFGIQLVAGRDFTEDIPTDISESVLVNETLVNKLNWNSPEEALGKTMQRDHYNLNVIGVINDFNVESLHAEIDPLIVTLPGSPDLVPQRMEYFAVRIGPGNPADALAYMEEKWKEFDRGRPFEFFFLDSELDKLYKNEQQTGSMTGLFSLICIFVACLGLFGLTSYATQARSKDIGIRKVMGASVLNIVVLISREFAKLLIIANLIAWPVAWLLLNRWLENFAYRIELSLWPFLLSGLLALTIALLSVGWHTTRAAQANPVDSLRDE